MITTTKHKEKAIMTIKLNAIENLRLPKRLSDSNRVPTITVQCVVEAITCIISEYAISVLKLDTTDESVYPYIRKYFEGEVKAKYLLKKLLTNYEISAFFDLIPKFENVQFKAEEWDIVLENISITSSDTDNTYYIRNKTFNSKKYFFSIMQSKGKLLAQKYFKDPTDGKAYFLTLGNDDELTFIKNPFYFSTKNNDSVVTNFPKITEEVFFNIDELKSADQEQKEAIKATTDKNLVILAGAGSGKTRTLVSRLAYLHLVKGVSLSDIILLTFTTAAAAEMKTRAQNLIKRIYFNSNNSKQPYVNAKTFDAFFRKIVLEYFVEIGFMQSPQLELSQDENLIDKRCKMLNDVIVENQMESIFSSFLQKNSLKELLNEVEDYAKGFTISLPGIDRLLDLFLEKQIENNTILGFLYVNLIVKKALYQEQSILKEKLAMRYSCILIDEFQDISALQNETLKLFYDTSMHFTFVGDDDQSIYAWRGADVSIIQDIVNNKNTVTKFLLTNYRNNPNIVKAGNCILRLVENRAKHNEIKPYKTTGSKIRISKSDSQYKNVVDEIDTIIKNGCEPKEICVLARKNKQVDSIKTALEAMKIPVVTQEVRINLRDTYYVMMKALINIYSNYELIKACMHIKQLARVNDSNINEKKIYKIIRGEMSSSGNLEVIQRISQEVFDESVSFLSTIVDRFAEKAGEVFERIVFGEMKNSTIEAFSDYCKECEAPWPISQQQLKSIYISFERNNNTNRKMNKKMVNGVSVSTIHNAKGLEYNVVMIVGLNLGEYPNIGLIDKQYNQKVRELELLKIARNKYYELRNKVTDVLIRGLFSDCNNESLTNDEKDIINSLAIYVKRNQRLLKQLNADAIDGFLDIYKQTIIPIERNFAFEQAKISKEISEYENILERKREEFFIDNDNVDKEKNENEYVKLKSGILSEISNRKENSKLLKLNVNRFNNVISNLKYFNKIGFIASGLLADMSRAEEIESIKEQLEKERKVRIAEERRTFYVAVTRARDHLYLFTDENCNESEFISEIDDDLKTTYTALSKNERKEFERLTGGLRSEFKNIDLDEETINSKINNIINDSHFKKHIALKLKEYYDANPAFFALPKESKRYFEQGLSLIFIGELTGTDFSTEFAHNIQKSAECLLEYAAGDNAIPYTTNDYNLIDRIAKKIRRDAVICSTQIPTKRYIENIISITNNNRIDSLKRAGIEHYVVRSHNFWIDSKIYSSWKQKKINGDSQKFLKSVLDLSNIRNVLVHEKEDRWPEDAVTDILNNFKYIAKCCKI